MKRASVEIRITDLETGQVSIHKFHNINHFAPFQRLSPVYEKADSLTSSVEVVRLNPVSYIEIDCGFRGKAMRDADGNILSVDYPINLVPDGATRTPD